MHSHFERSPWSLPLGLTATLLILAILYIRGWSHLRKEDGPKKTIPISRLFAFLSGLLLVWIAVGSPLGLLDHRMLTAHMVQHLLLMAVAAPLLLLGAPVEPLSAGLPRSVRVPLTAVANQPWVRSLGRAITHPVFCLLASSLTLIAWHVPALFETAMRSSSLHHVQWWSFLATGILFWWPVVQPWPSTARWPRWVIPVYLFFATLPCDALSAFLTFCDRSIYPSYQSAAIPFDLSPLADQQLAGSFMWLCVTVIYLVPAVAITLQILSPAAPRSVTENGRVPDVAI